MFGSSSKVYQVFVGLLVLMSFNEVTSQPTITMLTPYVLTSQGSTAVLIAQASTTLTKSQVNWYFQGTAITSNGIIIQQSGKYVANSNDTYYTLTISNLKSADFGFYSLLYLNIPTIIVANATISEISTVSVISNCKNPRNQVAICIMLIFAYCFLVATLIMIYLLTRPEIEQSKMRVYTTLLLVLSLQASTSFIIAMITLWSSFYFMIDNRNTTATGLALIGFLIIWFAIFFFASIHCKQKNYQLIYIYVLLITITLQVAMLIGIIICVAYCGTNITLPLIEIDYGMLGILFAVITLAISALTILFAVAYLKSKHFKKLVVSVLSNSPDSDEKHNETSAQARDDKDDGKSGDESDGTEKDPKKKKKSLKSKLKNKFKSIKGNKVQTNGSVAKSENNTTTVAVSPSTQKKESPTTQKKDQAKTKPITPNSSVVLSNMDKSNIDKNTSPSYPTPIQSPTPMYSDNRLNEPDTNRFLTSPNSGVIETNA